MKTNRCWSPSFVLRRGFRLAGVVLLLAGCRRGEAPETRGAGEESLPDAALFVFAHSDDEFGIIGQVDRLHRAGVEVHGVWTCTSPGRRDESRAAWDVLGIPAERLHFVPGPGRSVESLTRTRDALADLLDTHRPAEVYVVAYEGGHFQHDLTHVALVEALRRSGFAGCAYEFGLYHFHAFPFPTALRPIPASTRLVEILLPRETFRRLEELLIHYPSQKHVIRGFQWGLPRWFRMRQRYRVLPRWDYTRRPYAARPLWYEASPRHGQRFERDFQPLIEAYYRAAGAPPAPPAFEQDIRKKQRKPERR